MDHWAGTYTFSGQYHDEGEKYSSFSGMVKGTLHIDRDGSLTGRYMDKPLHGGWGGEQELEGELETETSAMLLELQGGNVIWYLEPSNEQTSEKTPKGEYEGFGVVSGPEELSVNDSIDEFESLFDSDRSAWEVQLELE